MPLGFVEHVDHAGFGPGELRRLGDDRVEHGLQSSVELTAWLTSPSARSSPTDRVSSRVRAWTSSNRRTFSIAITAWSAKVVTSSICLSVNGRRVALDSTMTPMGFPRAAAGRRALCESRRVFDASMPGVFRIGQDVGNVNGFASRARRGRRACLGPARSDAVFTNSRDPGGSRSAQRCGRRSPSRTGWYHFGLAQAARPTRPACRARFADRRSSG